MIAYIIPHPPPPPSPREQRFLEQTNLALLGGALGGTIVALMLGFVLARTFTRPLRDLTTATHAMAGGKLGLQVPVRSQDEIGQLAVAFNQMSADLAHANALRRQMTADIAHELRNPLVILSGYIEALHDGVFTPTPALLSIMYDEVQHLQRLVDDLRTLSLADAGALPLQREEIAPASLLEQIVTTYELQAMQQNITLMAQADPACRFILVDPHRLAQVLGNLVGNALRHTPAGGSIILRAQHDGSFVTLSVSDTGEGISVEALPYIFDRFYRATNGRESEHGESGLGLAIAKSIVEAHGGTISVTSVQGCGATFMIRLPAIAPPK